MTDETPKDDVAPGPSGMMTLEELADHLNRSGHPVALRTLRDHCSAGVLRAKKIRRTWYVASEEIPAYARFLDQPEPIVRAGAPRTAPKPVSGPIDVPIDGSGRSSVGTSHPEIRPAPIAPPTAQANDVRLVQEERDAFGRLRLLVEWAIMSDGRREKSGRFERYAASGRKIAEGRYVAGQLDGTWREWTDDGVLSVEGAHSRGRQSGVWTTFAVGGQKLSEGTYRDGLAHGVFSFFAKDGRVLREIEYSDGVAVSDRSTAASK